MEGLDLLIKDIVFKIVGDKDADIDGDKIVPIIGPEVFYVEKDDNKFSVQEYLARQLLSKESDIAHVAPEIFKDAKRMELCMQSGMKGTHHLSSLFKSAGFTLINKLFQVLKEDGGKIKLRDEVRRFLERGNFPLIITTVYFRALEELIHCKGEKYSSIAYQCEKNRNQDIKLSPVDSTLAEPAIFHIFGLAKPCHACVLTEEDFLTYIHCLQDTNTCPQHLRQYLKDKYILTIGCDIPDWTFRLLLYSLKESGGQILTNEANRDSFIGGAVSSNLEKDFVSFLDRIKYYSDSHLYEFLETVTERLPKDDRPGIFLSICSEEYKEIGTVLRQKLSKRFNVWYCDKELTGKGGEAYWSEIRKGLEECRYFMPVVTPTAYNKLLKSGNESKPLPDEEGGIITEWKYAAEIWRRKYKPSHKKYCFPYRMMVNMNDFKGDLKQKVGGVLFELFFNEFGIQHIENVRPQDFSPENIAL